jgi:GNAT superfamily N-acetyltransferase
MERLAARDSHKDGDLPLRYAGPDDVASVAVLINQAYLVESFFVEGDRTSADEVREDLATGQFLLATTSAGELAACVYVELSGERGYFGLLAVHPSCQGQGLGSRMIAAAENHCRKAGCRFMDLQVVNLRAELPPIYRKLGYLETGRAPFSDPLRLKQPCEFILMSKSL